MPKVLVTQPSVTGVDDPRLEALHAAGWEVNYQPAGARMKPDELLELVQGHDAVIASSEPYTRAVLEGADTLKHVARWGVGFDQVDVPAATELGVLVTTTVGANDWGVADHAFALIFSLARRTVENDKLLRSGGWSRPPGRDVWRKTLGIVGLGRIGRGVAQRASGFEMKVLAYEPYPDTAFCEKWGVELVSLEDLLQRSDYVTLHAPGGGENVHLINADRLALMKSTAYLVNTARGSLIDEEALERGARRRQAGRRRPRRPRAGAADRHPLQRPAERGPDGAHGRRHRRDQRRDDRDGRREHRRGIERREAGRPAQPGSLGPPPNVLTSTPLYPLPGRGGADPLPRGG